MDLSNNIWLNRIKARVDFSGAIKMSAKVNGLGRDVLLADKIELPTVSWKLLAGVNGHKLFSLICYYE